MRMIATMPEEDLEVRDRLIMDHVGLVKSLASRLAHRVPAQVEVNELISVGVIGLIDAAGAAPPLGARSTPSPASASRARCSTRCGTSTGRRARSGCGATSTARSPGCGTTGRAPKDPRLPAR
jgi:hypothetical protein